MAEIADRQSATGRSDADPAQFIEVLFGANVMLLVERGGLVHCLPALFQSFQNGLGAIGFGFRRVLCLRLLGAPARFRKRRLQARQFGRGAGKL